MRLTHLLFLFTSLAISYCATHYYLGDQGLSCNEVCFKQKKNCHPRIVTNDNYDLFTSLGVTCKESKTAWNSQAQPAYVSDKKSPDYGKCKGYIGTPAAGHCFASDPSVQRLCRCDDPEDGSSAFGYGFSAGSITLKEQWIFQHFVKDGDVGVMTHFWITYQGVYDEGTIIRYYVDGEKEASIKFTPAMASGVGFYDQTSPWGKEWFGKGAKNGAWYNNIRIPFQKSIIVTVQHTIEAHGGFYMILSGATNVPIVLGGVTLPTTAKMNLRRIDSTYRALDFVTLVNVLSGPGAHFMTTLAVESPSWDFLQGCVHGYFDGRTDFPGILLGTGTEDYFNSAWYFDGGKYHHENGGETHEGQSEKGTFRWSAYRVHDKDPLFFNDGFKLQWRVGDKNDVTGMKCHTVTGGKTFGDAQKARVGANMWYYTWPATA